MNDGKVMINLLQTSRDIVSQMKADRREGPVQLLHLVKFRKVACYEDGATASGPTAYDRYRQLWRPVFQSLGGWIIWSGDFEQTLVGPVGEKWDLCFIAQYPSLASFTAMLGHPSYREAAKHYQAAVESARLIRLSPQPNGVVFG